MAEYRLTVLFPPLPRHTECVVNKDKALSLPVHHITVGKSCKDELCCSSAGRQALNAAGQAQPAHFTEDLHQ